MTYDPTYTPFPEAELLRIAQYHESVAANVAKETRSSYLQGVHLDRAAACRNAVAAQNALRERFLEQSMTVRRLEAERTERVA